MPAIVRGDKTLPQTIFVHFYHPLTWESYRNTVNQVEALIAAADHPVYVLSTTTVDMPKGNAIYHLKQTVNMMQRHPNFKMWVTVIEPTHRIAHTFIKITFQIFGVPLHIFPIMATEADARTHIQQAQLQSKQQNGS